jgi:GNAT superfamily N-acetyltransferase
MIVELLLSFWSTWPIMKGITLLLLTLLLCIYHLDAFLANPYHPRSATSTSSFSFRAHAEGKLGHEDIIWKLRPPPETSRWKKFTLRFASNVIRLECKINRVDPPFCLCPKGGQAMLEAHLPGISGKVARFGITTIRGPPAPPIDESVEEIYSIALEGRSVGSAAIIYMFVEPSHRKQGIGELALEVISVIHAVQGCDFTLLVADDNGSGKLVEWYEQHGFNRAPKLQAMLGSPDGKFGTTMIKPTTQQISPACKLQWW